MSSCPLIRCASAHSPSAPGFSSATTSKQAEGCPLIAAVLGSPLVLESGTVSSGAHKEGSRRPLIGRDNWTAQSPSANILEDSEIRGFEEKQSEPVQREDVKVTFL